MAIQVFGAGAVQSAYVSYLALDITANSLTLVWADSYVDVPYTDPSTGIHYQVLAASMDVTTGADNTNSITLPNAMESSVGQNFIITNIGVSHFSLKTSDETDLVDVEPGISYWVQLTDNSTEIGQWRSVTFGAGTSQASAIALAGNGLVALIDKLNTNIPIILTDMIPVIDVTSRAKLVVWTGGAANLPLPTIGSIPAGYYVSFSNQGTAQIIIQPGEPVTTISGQTNLAIQAQQSLTIISDGTNWQTLGFGQNQFAVATSLTLDVSASVNVTLNNVQAASIIQQYIGALTANITVFFPLETNDWFIYNNTTGAHTLSVQLVGPTGASYVIPQGSKGIFYSNGTGLFVTPTALSLIDGTKASPAIAFSSGAGTGIYNDPGDDAISISIQNNDVGFFAKQDALTNTGGVVAPNGTTLFTLTATNTIGTIDFNDIDALSIDGTGAVTLPVGPLTLTTGQFLGPNGTKALPTLSFSATPDTGFYNIPASPAVAVSIGGVLAAAFQTAGTTGAVVAISSGGINLQLAATDTFSFISYNGVTSIRISSTGVVTLPAAPLPIASGGTNAVTQNSALNNLMPAFAGAGTIIYFNGANWVNLPIGVDGQVLTIVAGLPAWV